MPAGGETRDDLGDEDLVARLALHTRWSPDQVLDTHPHILDRVIVHIQEQAKQRARERLQSRLKGRRGR